MMGFDEILGSVFTFAPVGTPVVIDPDGEVFTERAAREDDPMRRRRMNELAVSAQNTARIDATRRVKAESTRSLWLLVVFVLLCRGVLWWSCCWRASEDIYLRD